MLQGNDISHWLRRQLPAIGMVLLGAFLLCLPAIWNGFPLVYSDTGAYLATAFEGKVPMARPTGYGLFIRYTSLGGHIWWPIFAQGLLTAALLMRALRVALPAIDIRKAYPIAFAISMGCTGMAWYVSQLMPDVFTGLLALTFFLILFDQDAKWWGRLLYAALAYVFCFAHYSHTAMMLFLAGSALAVGLLQRIRRRPAAFPLAGIVWAALPALLAVFSYYYVNYSNDLGWRMTRSAHVFTVARLSETGMLQEYLHETCAEKHWSLCPYADSLPPSAADFIWNENSPFKRTGYWEGSKPGYDSLLSDFFGRPRFVKWYLKEASKAGFKQMFAMSVGEGLTPYNESSSPYKFFERAMPAQIPAYVASRQFEREFSFAWERWLLNGIMVVSALLLVVVGLLRRRQMSPILLWFSVVASASYVANAVLTGALANVYSRLQARIAWLIPLVTALFLAHMISKLKK